MHVQVDDSKLHNHEQISWQDGIMIHHNRDHLSNSNSDMADGSESWSLTGAGLRSEGTVELRGSVATNAVSWSRAAVQKVQLWEPWQLSDPWTRQAWVSPWHSSRDTAGNLYFQVSSGLWSEGTVEPWQLGYQCGELKPGCGPEGTVVGTMAVFRPVDPSSIGLSMA